MNIWEILSIEQTTDVREIKKAYAFQLKKNKPDDDPDAFQRLHNAYKWALSHAKFANQRSASELETSAPVVTIEKNESDSFIGDASHIEDNDSDNVLTAQFSKSDSTNSDVNEKNINQNIDAHYLELVNELESLKLKAELLIGSSQKRNVKNEWYIFCQSPVLLEPELNEQLSLFIFQLIGNLIKSSRSSRHDKYRLGMREVIDLLNQTFFWSDQKAFLYSCFGEKFSNRVLRRLSQKQVENYYHKQNGGLKGGRHVEYQQAINTEPKTSYTYYYGSDIKRLVAFVLDSAFAVALSHPVLLVIKLMFSNRQIQQLISIDMLHNIVVVIIFSIICVLSESSKFQTTLGKWIMGLKVTDQNLQRPNSERLILRALVFSLTTIGGVLTMFINAWLDGVYIHDRVTGTRVIDIRNSQ